jgi:hypothetical protein
VERSVPSILSGNITPSAWKVSEKEDEKPE